MTRQASFEIPDEAELIVATHLLELRQDLALPDDIRQLITEPRDDLFLDWSSQAKAALVGLPDLPTPEFSPATLLVFRRVYSHERPDLIAAFAAFDEMLESLVDPVLLEPVTRLREATEPHGMFDWITVVAATRFVPTTRWPTEPAEQSGLLGGELDASLTHLNDLLIALSLARHDPSISPITRGDLPALCPVILETAPTAGSRNGVAYPYQIHENHAFPRPASRSFEELNEQERSAFQIARSAFFGTDPFFLFYSLIQDALRDFNAARYDKAAISTGTAIEVLLSSVLRAAVEARRLPATEAEDVLRLPLRNQVEHHFSQYVSCFVDLDDQANPFGGWWSGGYRLRNKVVHSAYRPRREEAVASLDGAMKLIAAIKSGLLSDVDTQALGRQLQWGPVPGNVNEP